MRGVVTIKLNFKKTTQKATAGFNLKHKLFQIISWDFCLSTFMNVVPELGFGDRYSSFNSCTCAVKRANNMKCQCWRVCFLSVTMCSLVFIAIMNTNTRQDKHSQCMQSCFPCSAFLRSQGKRGFTTTWTHNWGWKHIDVHFRIRVYFHFMQLYFSHRTEVAPMTNTRTDKAVRDKTILIIWHDEHFSSRTCKMINGFVFIYKYIRYIHNLCSTSNLTISSMASIYLSQHCFGILNLVWTDFNPVILSFYYYSCFKSALSQTCSPSSGREERKQYIL